VHRAESRCAYLREAAVVNREAGDFLRHRLAFSAEIVASLEQRAAEEEVPASTVFVAAVVALLARYTGRHDVSLEVHAEGHERRVQIRLDSDPDAAMLFGRTALALAATPTPGSDWAGCPPSEVRSEQTMPGSAGGIQVLVRLERTSALGDADFIVAVEGPALDLYFRKARFEAWATPRITEHLRALVLGLSQTRGPVSSIPIVQGEEREWVLGRSNATSVDREEALPSVVECFERHARATPDAIALIEGDRELSYRELDAAADGLCDALRARGVGSGVHVATYLERGADAVIALLGILKARGVYVPLDTSYPAARGAAVLASAAPSLVVTRAASASALRSFSDDETTLPLFFVDQFKPSAASGTRPAVRRDDPAYIFFTSGSTGRPKGVIVEHRALGNYVRAAADAYGVVARDRVLQAASLGFDLSLEEILITLTAGAALVIRSAGPIESVQAFFDECVARRLTVLSITSALWHELTLRLADGSAQLPPLIRLVILGADVARPDVLPAWQRATRGRVRLVNSYGLTETTIVATVWEAGEQPLTGDWRALPIGRPLRNVSAYVLDPKGELVPVGVAGEICIGGLAVARGYLNDEELTRSRFVPDPYLPGGWMYRSGDRAILRPSGELEFLGRADFRVKVQGVRIELGELEVRLREVPGVVEAVAVARTNPMGETELEVHAMVASDEVTPAQLRAHLQAVLPAAAVPARVHVVERFPLTAAGKIDRRALAARVPSTPRMPSVVAQSPLEKLVIATTAEVLGIHEVGLQDGFLGLGGTSLSAVRAASVLSQRLGRRLGAQLFLECPSFADLCTALERPEQPRESLRPLHALENDAILTSEIGVTELARSRPGPLGSVLLTGATGYFGSFVLTELLRETTAEVVCLVRAASPDAARARIVTGLTRRGCSVAPSVLAARVSCVCGDVARPRFGLDPETFLRLGERVDAIFHAAARVSMLLPYDALRATNALALEWVLRLATTGKPKTVHHVSTVEVLADADPSQPGALSERAAARSPALEGGYGQSKWVAEKLIEQARARGMRAYIHRPGRLTGHSLTGAFNEDDFLVQLLDACGRVGAAPVLNVDVDLTPVDVAARALVRLAKREPEQEISHLVHPAPLPWSTLLETVLGLGYPLRVLPHGRWCSLLQELAARDERTTFASYIAALSREEIEASLRGGYATEATRAALGPGFEWPPIDARLLGTYLRAMSDAGRFWLEPSPRRSSMSPPSARSSGKLVVSG
jgi:amino acid adenylation domain-containing protein/thioester reductase-like protein